MESSVVARSRPAPPGRRRPAANSNLNNNDISNPSSRTSSPATKHSSLHPETDAASTATSTTSSNLTTTPTTNQPSALSESQRSNLSDGVQILPTDLDARERLKNALRDCDKEELVKALTDAKDQIDQLDSSLENTTLSLEESQQLNQNLSTKLTELENHSVLLQHDLNEREARITEASTETNSLEQELFYLTSQNESLRNQLKEAESQKALAEKQYQEGNVSAEKEREYYEGLEEMMEKLKQSHNASTEKLRKEKADTEREMMKLRDRLDESTTTTTSSSLDQDEIKSSASSSNGIPPSTSSNTTSPEFLTLQSELAHLHKSHSTLSSTLHQLQSELKEVKSNRDELRDENETYRDILQEKTFSGALLAESAVLSGWKGVGGREGVVKGVFGNDDEESEDDDEDQDAAVKNQDDVDDVPDTPRAMDSEKEKSKRNSRKKSNRSSQHLLDVPTDLASELEENEEDKDALEKRKEEERRRLERKRERNGEVSSDVSVLQKEVFELRDANKALTLYISKIIDRIVAKEGYESVLAADDDRSGKKAAGVGSMRRKAQATRPSVLPTSPTQPTPITEDQSRSSAALKAARRQSGSILSLVGRATGVSDSTTTTSPPQSNSQGQSQKRRTASIDWRSLIPGSSSSTNSSDANSNPNLRPFSLQASVPSGSGNRASMSAVASPSSAARRLAPTEEIEDATDKAERERIRAELEEQGITPPENQLRPNIITRPAHVSTPSSSALGAFFQRVVSGSTSSNNETAQPTSEKSNTNLSTGSSMIRTPSFDGPKLTTFQDPSPSRPQSESPIQISDKDQLRSKALDVGNDSLTEYSRPVRNTRNSDRSVSNRSSISRSSSVGGDESYGLPN